MDSNARLALDNIRAADDEVETLNASEELHERSGWRRGVGGWGGEESRGKKAHRSEEEEEGLSAASPLC